MRPFLLCLILALASLMCSPASAFGGRWLRGGSCGPSGCSPASVSAAAIARTSMYPANARPAPVTVGETATAQGVANIMARLGRVGHFGGHHPYFEGCGMAGTPQAAYGICCFANSGMRTVDVGYARGAGGQWFCCRRYAAH